MKLFHMMIELIPIVKTRYNSKSTAFFEQTDRFGFRHFLKILRAEKTL
jgi:hypothetical protein